jgi:uncharacterized SAM-binding protein YcdF (DUF218 family)
MIFPKFLSHLPAPIGIVLIVMGIAIYKRSRMWMFGAAALLALFGSSPISSLLVVSLESRYPVLAPAAAVHTDAIVILGGITKSTQSYPAARFDLNDQTERMDEGARLYHAGTAPVVVLTSGGLGRQPSEEGDHLRRYLIEILQVPAEDIVHTSRLSRNTAEESLQVGELAKARGWKSITLVTSAYHMPRSMLLFARTGLQANPHPVDFRAIHDPQEPVGSRWFPRADFLNQTEMAMREYYGIAYYQLFGR